MALSRQSPAEAGLTTGSEPVEDPGFSGIRVRAGEPEIFEGPLGPFKIYGYLTSARTLLSFHYWEGFVSDWWLYMCQKKERLYVGITTNVEKRLKQHGSPCRGAKIQSVDFSGSCLTKDPVG